MLDIIQFINQQISFLNPLYLTIAVLSFLFFAYFLIKWLTSSPHRNPPPSPPKLPILGNLHQLGKNIHRSLSSLAQRYGPDLMLLHFGSKPVVVVSSSDAAREIVKTHDIAFSSRPTTAVYRRLLYNNKDVAGAPYGEYWRQMRSICVLHLLSNRRVQSYRSVREEEVGVLIEKIKQFSSKSLPVNLSQMLSCLTNDVISRIAFGRKYSGDDGEDGIKFQRLLGDFMRLLGSFSVGEYIPFLGWINWINGLNKSVDRTAKELDEFIDAIVEEHMDGFSSEGSEEDVKDFVHVLLELQKEYGVGGSLDRESIKALILDVFAGGTDTSSTVLEWIMTELIRHPRVMKELQNEVKRVAREKASTSHITEADLDKMHYTKLVIKEALRLYSPLPLLGPRETIQDVKVMGYHIAAGTMVLTNGWAISRDPKTWTKPEEFWPERFLNNSIDFRGHDFEFIPFGTGRRGCPGVSFALPVVELVLANLVKNFEWALPDGAKGEDLDLAETFGVTIHRKNPLLALATPTSD
ncbi:cytochrome P450, putative [Ricinus communis]|uniref:Cytochrome P450, putative n=1 Tax=Ricinus communis TaxID=3988 RepID=B9RAS3_RICCO|nr:cytochrome P450, putative [Ricinus communis]|eukprot:XP_002511298.1 cytochrome P450 71A26 [Ricinus communis]